MCTELHVRGENLWIEQARELAALVGRENILWWVGDGDVEEVGSEPEWHNDSLLDFCLCPIAVQETMEKAGYTVIQGWDQPESGDYVAFKAPPATTEEPR